MKMDKHRKTRLIAIAALLIALAYPAYIGWNVFGVQLIHNLQNSCNPFILQEFNLSGSGFQTLQQQNIIFVNEPVKLTALFDKDVSTKINDVEVYLKGNNGMTRLCNNSQIREGMFECDFKVDASENFDNYAIFLNSSRNDCKRDMNGMTNPMTINGKGMNYIFLTKKYKVGETATNGKISVKVDNLEYSKDASHEGWNIFSYNATVENINYIGEISPMNFGFVANNGEYFDGSGLSSMFNLNHNLRIGEKESGKLQKSVRNETSISEIIYSFGGSYFIFYT